MEYSMPDSIATERTLLRHFQESDLEDIHEYYGDEQATRYTTGKAFNLAESWRALVLMIGHWQVRGFGPYAMQRQVDGKVLGLCGLWHPNDWPEPEIKWALSREFWGQGYGSEAARAVQKAAAEHLPGLSLISFIQQENKASIRLAEAVDARLEKTLPFRGGTWCVMRYPKLSS